MMNCATGTDCALSRKAATINVQLSRHETWGVVDYVSGFDSGRGLFLGVERHGRRQWEHARVVAEARSSQSNTLVE